MNKYTNKKQIIPKLLKKFPIPLIIWFSHFLLMRENISAGIK